VLQNVEEMHSILLQTTSTGLVSFCVTDNFVVTIETQSRRQKKNVEETNIGIDETEEISTSNSSSVADRVSLLNVFSQSTGQFLYTIALNELEYDYDSGWSTIDAIEKHGLKIKTMSLFGCSRTRKTKFWLS
jgi:hypothetical protein